MNKKGNRKNAERQYGAKPITKYDKINALYQRESKYGIKDWLKKCIGNYANFKGRARRKEYWLFFITAVVFIFAALGGDYLISSKMAYKTYGGIGGVALLLTAPPVLATGARRLHDIGRTGWWQLLWILPSVIGVLALIIANMYAVRAGIPPEDVVKEEVAAVSYTFIIVCWFAITVFLAKNTSPNMNRYGAPAKRTGKKTKYEAKDRKKNEPLI